jgi:predicted sugar kinase
LSAELSEEEDIMMVSEEIKRRTEGMVARQRDRCREVEIKVKELLDHHQGR